MLAELQQVARFEDLDDALARLADAPGIDALCDSSLACLLADQGPAAASVLSALSVAQEGLPEERLARLVGAADASAVSALRVRRLCAAFGSHVIDLRGRFSLRETALAAALARSGRVRAVESRLRELLVEDGLADPGSPGAAEEALGQLVVLDDWDRLRRALSDPGLAAVMLRRSPDLYAAHWRAVQIRTGASASEALAGWAGREEPGRIALAAGFLADRDQPHVAKALARDALARAEDRDTRTRACALQVLAQAAEASGDVGGAIELLDRLGALADGANLSGLKAATLVNAARLALLRGGPDAVEPLLPAAREAATAAPDGRVFATCLEVEAILASERGRHRRAARLYVELAQAAERVGDLAAYATARSGVARMQCLLGRRARAGETAGTARRLASALGDRRLLAEVAAVETLIAMDLEQATEVERLLAERRALVGGDVVATLQVQIDQAVFLSRSGTTAGLAAEFAAATAARARAAGLPWLAERLTRALQA